MTFELLNSLSISRLYLLLYTLSIIFGPYIVRKKRAIGSLPFLLGLVERWFCLTCHVRWPHMFSQPAEAPICRSDLKTHVILRCHKSSQVHKFVDHFKILVAKGYSLSGVENSCIEELCLLIEDGSDGCSFARRTLTSSTTLKCSVDNRSPCLSPCHVSKGPNRNSVFWGSTCKLSALLWLDVLGREIKLRHYNTYVSLKSYEKMMSSDLEFVAFSRICHKANMLICLTGTLLCNAVLPRLRRVIGGKRSFGEDFIRYTAIILAIKFITFLVHWTQYTLGPALRWCLANPSLLDHLVECIHESWSTAF
jgi:hypothetical protein